MRDFIPLDELSIFESRIPLRPCKQFLQRRLLLITDIAPAIARNISSRFVCYLADSLNEGFGTRGDGTRGQVPCSTLLPSNRAGRSAGSPSHTGYWRGFVLKVLNRSVINENVKGKINRRSASLLPCLTFSEQHVGSK